MRDRRFEPRHPTYENIEIGWAGDAGVDQKCPGVLRDLSRSGARIQLDRPIRLQTPLRIGIRDMELRGRVASCVLVESTYMVGVEFDPEFQGKIKTRPKG
ncbi:MAG TPA: PilZ domain-containing protein [Bryobacteraceae bacterium]|nr:PilZ domain-containing protein [Bryobacteraceae bacterium]